jgi:PAS domain-containing protein
VSAARAAQVALALRDSYPAPGLAARLAPVGALVRSLWYEAELDPLTCLDDGFRQGIEDGEPAMALDNLMLAVAHRFVLGAPLSELAEQVDRVRQLAARYGVPDPSGTAAGAIARLRGLPVPAPSPSIVGAVTAYLFGEAEPEPVPAQRPGSFLGAVSDCFHALGLADRYPTAAPDTQRTISAELVEHQARLDEWAGHSPAHFGAYAALLSAQRTRLAGDAERAADRYSRAVDTAREHGLLLVEALAAELGGRHALARGQAGVAVAYLRRARDCYQRWRAPALVAHVDRTLAAVPTRPDRTFDQLDLLAMVRAFQAIAGELSPDRLVVTLLKLLIEHTHAERGALLLPAEPGLHLAATARAEQGRITVLADLDRPSAAHVPMSVVEYVHRHRRPLGGRPDELPAELSGDAYLRRHAPSALACTPILRGDRLIAVLYLEHRHLSGWFGAEHLDLLDVLCAQAAIAFDHADTHARLVEANQILDATFDRLPVGLILLGPDLRVRRASPRAIEVTGVPIDPGTPLMDLFDLPYLLDPGFARIGPDRDPIARDAVITNPDVEPRRVHTLALPLRDPSNTLIGVTLWVSPMPETA